MLLMLRHTKNTVQGRKMFQVSYFGVPELGGKGISFLMGTLAASGVFRA